MMFLLGDLKISQIACGMSPVKLIDISTHAEESKSLESAAQVRTAGPVSYLSESSSCWIAPVDLQVPSMSCSVSLPILESQVLLWTWHLDLCRALNQRSDIRDGNADIDEQVRVAGNLLAALPQGHCSESQALRALGIALCTRFQRLGSHDDLDLALIAHRQATCMCHEHGHACSECLRELGWCLYRSSVAYKCNQPEALRLLYQALSMNPDAYARDPQFLAQLGACLIERLYIEGNWEDFRLCEQYFEDALDLLPCLHPDRSRVLSYLGQACQLAFDLTRDFKYIHRALGYLREALELQSKGHPRRALSLLRLTNALEVRYTQLGNPIDLDDSISVLHEALELIPAGHLGRAFALSVQGRRLGQKFELCGDIEYLERSVVFYREAVSLSAPADHRYQLFISELGDVLFRIYRHSGESQVLHEAIELHRKLLSRKYGKPIVLPLGIYETTISLSLGRALQQKYHDFGCVSSLNEAVALYLECIEHGIPDFYLRSRLLHQYARALHLQHCHQPCAAKIDEAIRLFNCVLELRPPGHTERHLTILDLVTTLCTRFGLDGKVEDVSVALELLQEIPKILPFGHPGRPLGVFLLARLFLLRGSPYLSYSEAVQLLLNGLCDAGCHPQVRLEEAMLTLQNITGASDIDRAPHAARILDAYRLTVTMLPRVAFFGLSQQSKLRVLSKASDLASIAAVHAMRMDDVEAAVELLEEGRAVFWAQHLKLRTPFEALPKDLSERLRLISAELRRVPVGGLYALRDNVDETDPGFLDASSARLRCLSEEFEAAVRAARCHPGHERFLMPQTFSALTCAAKGAPIVILLASPAGCHAILLQGNEKTCQAISLPQLSMKILRSIGVASQQALFRGRRDGLIMGSRLMKISQGRSEVASLQDIWERIMQPVICALSWQV